MADNYSLRAMRRALSAALPRVKPDPTDECHLRRLHVICSGLLSLESIA